MESDSNDAGGDAPPGLAAPYEPSLREQVEWLVVMRGLPLLAVAALSTAGGVAFAYGSADPTTLTGFVGAAVVMAPWILVAQNYADWMCRAYRGPVTHPVHAWMQMASKAALGAVLFLASTVLSGVAVPVAAYAGLAALLFAFVDAVNGLFLFVQPGGDPVASPGADGTVDAPPPRAPREFHPPDEGGGRWGSGDAGDVADADE